MQGTPHIRLILRENVAQKAVGFNQYFLCQLILPREGKWKHKVLDIDMSIWASYLKSCQNFPFPLAVVYFPESLDVFNSGSKTGINNYTVSEHRVLSPSVPPDCSSHTFRNAHLVTEHFCSISHINEFQAVELQVLQQLLSSLQKK